MAGRDMRVVAMSGAGGPEVLGLTRRPRPEPRPGEVLVRVAYSGVNRADLLQRRGRYPAPPGWPPDILGLEFAGVVEEAGEGARRFVAGDRVMGLVGGGGYAEYVAVPERELLPVPAGLDLEGAGAVPEAFLTAFDALFRQMRLGVGETLLVHAAGSGVGTAAVQLAHAAGARTLGTSRTRAKLEAAASLGLDEGIDSGDGDWSARVLEATGGQGVDVILDLVGGPYLAGNLQVLAPRGRMIVVGVPGGSSAPIDLRRLMTLRASITGTVLRTRAPEERAALAGEAERVMLPLFGRGAVRPVVDAVFDPADAPLAHARMEADLNFGKLLIAWE